MTSSVDVAELAAGLLDACRDRPWGVVSISVDAAEPLVDVEYLHDEIGDVCRLFVIQTGDLTRELDALLPERCQVYGGAARIYPIGSGWTATPERSPLRFVHEARLAASVTEKLVTDALGMANEAGLFAQAAPSAVRVRGVVKTLLAGGTRGWVQLDSGDLAIVWHELTFPEIPLEWVLREGQRVEGMLDPQTRRLIIDVIRPDAKQLLEHYPHGAVTLALVLAVERQTGTLSVHPSLPIEVTRRDVSSNPFDRVDLLLAPGDVVPVRVIRDQQGRTCLRLSDVDDDEEVLPALALVPGGEPWLVDGRHRPGAASEEPVPDAASPTHSIAGVTPPDEFGPEPFEIIPLSASPLPGPGRRRVAVAPIMPTAATAARPVAVAQPPATALQSTQLALEEARSRLRVLEQQLKQVGGLSALDKIATLRLELGESAAQNRGLREELKKVKADQQDQRAMLRRSRQTAATSGYSDRRTRFDDDGDWVRHEVQLAWIDRLDAADRVTWPLPGFGVGERFASSLEQLDDGYKAKALKAAVDVLTGRVRELPTRRPHPLREGDGMSESDVVRSDGARCMRVHVEKNVASARRLHYWVLPDGMIELSRVVLHDDMEP
ncbi:hypothetical protein [Salinibacterium sp. ZJ454]|uniref:hypothetical protein n=1 Tax=Salinibacterium sp. ZJ454 TaxID=2708339 RepID=UPI0014234A29|nr:hypothetical protein [Salinibacterium sp. ZJ454]